MLRNPYALYSLWGLAARAIRVDDGVRTQIFRDTVALASASKANAEKIRARPGWQLAILLMVPINPSSGLSADGHSPNNITDGPTSSIGEEEHIQNLFEELVSLVILDSFDMERKGWRFVEELVALLWASQRPDSLLLTRRVIGRILNDICVQVRTSTNGAMNFSTIKMDNILHVLFLAEDVMFHHDALHDVLSQELSPPESPSSSFPERSMSYSSLTLSGTYLGNYDFCFNNRFVQ